MILVSSAHDLPSRLQQRAVGISDALEKPGLRAQLPDVLARLTGRAPAPPPRAIACGGSAPGQEVPEAHRLQILVAEDNEVNRLVIRGMLGRFGHSAHIVTNVQEAFEVATSEHESIDLVLMDCEMPVVDGFEATRRIRAWEAQERRGRLPIVALSAHALAEWQQRSRAAGMDDHLAKPVTMDALQRAVAALAGDERERRRA